MNVFRKSWKSSCRLQRVTWMFFARSLIINKSWCFLSFFFYKKKEFLTTIIMKFFYKYAPQGNLNQTENTMIRTRRTCMKERQGGKESKVKRYIWVGTKKNDEKKRDINNTTNNIKSHTSFPLFTSQLHPLLQAHQADAPNFQNDFVVRILRWLVCVSECVCVCVCV